MSREKRHQPGLEEINSQILSFSSLSFSVFPPSTYPPISYRLNTLFSNSLALTPFHFSLHLCFVSHQWPSFLQHTDNLLGRDFHYLRSGTIYQGMVFSQLLWLTGGSSLYWILYSTVPLFSPLKSQISLNTSLSRCSHSSHRLSLASLDCWSLLVLKH